VSRPALALFLAFAAVLGESLPGIAQQQIRPISVAVARPAGAPIVRPVPAGPIHSAIGTIARIGGPILIVTLRTRRPLRVDATTALARGSYSAPLFVGKYVIVQGRYGVDGTLFATSITRLPRLDATIPDR
jgi:hypothetical protein